MQRNNVQCSVELAKKIHFHHFTVWKFENFSPRFFLQKFRQSNYFTKELHCKLISRKFFEVGVNFRHYHSTTLCISSKNVVKSTHLEVNCTVCMMFSRNSFLVRVNVTSKISTLYCHCEMMRIRVRPYRTKSFSRLNLHDF